MGKSVKIGLGIATLFILIGLGYNRLGGFRPIDVTLVNCIDMELLGIEFRGTPQDEMLIKSFRKVEDTKLANPGAILHTIYYTEPAGKRDTMHVFVGVEKASIRNSVSKMTEKQIRCSQAVIAKISVHRFVMPSPLQIKEQIKAYAAREGVVLQGIFVDKILDKSNVEVWAPVIDG